MTVDQFEAVRPHLDRLSAQRITAARMALVDDISMQAIADSFGWSSRQTVSDAVTSVFAAMARYEATRLVANGANDLLAPPGWEAVTLIAPPELITRWRKELTNALGRISATAHNTQAHAQKPRKRRSTVAKSVAVLGESLAKVKPAKKSSRVKVAE